jgi:hypothetical protein
MTTEANIIVGKIGEADRFEVETREEAENLIATIGEIDPAGVAAGEYYIETESN